LDEFLEILLSREETLCLCPKTETVVVAPLATAADLVAAVAAVAE
jgi:hypothetical protein